MIAAAAQIALAMLAGALVLSLVRLARGPGLEDRALALDLMSTVCVAIAAVVAIRWDAAVFLDVAVVLALTAFIATLAFARYLERGRRREEL